MYVQYVKKVGYVHNEHWYSSEFALHPEFDPDNPLGGLDKPIKPPSCDKALWHFLGLSMASWNGLISLFGAGAVARLGLRLAHD